MQTGRLYTIRSHVNPDLIYVGSTTQTLSARMSGHRCGYRKWKAGGDVYITSFQILDIGPAYIELVRVVKFETKDKLFAAEGQLIRDTKCVNKVIPGRTHEEYSHQYYIDHKDKLDAISLKYYYDNREERIEKQMKYNDDHKVELREYHRENHVLNKEKQLKQMKTYREENKEKIKEYMSREVTCECGLKMKYSAKYVHIKKDMHKKRMELQADNLTTAV